MRFSSGRWVIALALVGACGDSKGGSSDATTSGEASTGEASTTGTGDASTGEASTGDASTADPPTTGGTGDASSTTGEASATTGEPAHFERFTLRSAAGPCPPNADCDGFVELLDDRTLRVEKFGEVGNPVTEVAIDEDDFSAAAAVFGAPALAQLLDGPDPLCNPPTDVFESMELVLDGQLRDATTTGCDQPPLAAAREMAVSLQTKYAP